MIIAELFQMQFFNLMLRGLFQLSAALKRSFPYDEDPRAVSGIVSCPPQLSPLLLQLLQALQLTHKRSPSLASVLQLCCSVAERYVGWLDLLLPPRARTRGEAQGANNEVSAVPTMLQLLGATWLSSGCSDAAAAIVAFILRKMEPAARIDLLSRMQVTGSCSITNRANGSSKHFAYAHFSVAEAAVSMSFVCDHSAVGGLATAPHSFQ